MVKRIVSLVVVLLPGCVVDTPVVETEDDPLGKDIGAWCQSMCDKVGTCIDDSTDGCIPMCVEYYSGFAGKGNFCRDAGLRVMDCMEGATCEELADSSGCDVSEAELSCLDSAAVTCEDAFTSGQPTQGFDCSVGFDICSDRKEYSLECRVEGDAPECRCMESGFTTGRFTPSRFACLSGAEAIQICGWPVVIGDELPPAQCESTGAELPGVNPAECAVQFDACDGQDYEVRCAGSVGNVVCQCNVDGLTVGSYESPTGICPFIEDPGSGSVAANYGCGFKIAPLGPG